MIMAADPKIDRATWLFLKLDKATWTLRAVPTRATNNRPTGIGRFLSANSRWGGLNRWANIKHV